MSLGLGNRFGRLGASSGKPSSPIIPGIITASSGVYNWSGDTMTPLVNHILTDSGGSYTYTGTAATMPRQYLIGATGGTYTYTGTDATLTIAAGGDAAETTAFLARTSGLSGTETDAYKALINGLVSDGVFSKLDCLYIFATKDTTTAALNLIQNNFNLTTGGSGGTFTADVGYTGSSSGSFVLKTAFNPTSAGGQFAQNSGSLGVYVLNSRSTSADETAIGANDGSDHASWILPKHSLGLIYDINKSALAKVANSNAQGLWISSRTASTTLSLYKNGNTTAIATDATASSGMVNFGMAIFADSTGAATYERYSNDQLSAAFIGGGLSSADMALVAARINTYMTTMGINVY